MTTRKSSASTRTPAAAASADAPKRRSKAPSDEAAVPKTRRGIQSIEVGFGILDALRLSGGPIPLRQIAERTGLAVANIHYYLVSFQAVGVVRQDPDTGFYGLGPYALRLGMAALEQFDVYTAARPVMAELAASLGHTVFLGVWGNRGPTIVYRIESTRGRPILELRVGTVLPLLSSALGRNFLAHLPRVLTDAAVTQELENTASAPLLDLPTSVAEVEKMIAGINKTGLSRCRDALLPQFTSLSAPVFDHLGEMVAAITIMGPKGTLDDKLDGETAQTLKAQATRISREAGWVG
ncbi:IclR family transcriptional regulator [Pigmentiphaga aceris]|uniref:IclR family transcriptional regulator n=1 Tax=Pigmentiphaga aceris TaxID=1940612 RepID=UPI001FE516B7|nr:IclR family transcriptional regulator [Pigmentiphaga aceris]